MTVGLWPDDGEVERADDAQVPLILALHGIGSLALLGLGVAIALRPKGRQARHRELGRLYAKVSLPILVLGFVIGLRHWPSLTPFQIVVPPTMISVGVGWWAATSAGRRRLGPAWIRVHVGGMGGSLIAWCTGFSFQVADRAGIPTDEPAIMVVLFAVPTIIGSPIINRAIARRESRRVREPQTGSRPLGRDEASRGGARDVRSVKVLTAEADVRGDRVLGGEVLDVDSVR